MVCRKGRRLIMVITESNRLITIITVRPFITPLRHIASVKKHRVIGSKKIFSHLSNEAIFAHEYILLYTVTFLHLQLHTRLSHGSTISLKCLVVTNGVMTGCRVFKRYSAHLYCKFSLCLVSGRRGSIKHKFRVSVVQK